MWKIIVLFIVPHRFSLKCNELELLDGPSVRKTPFTCHRYNPQFRIERVTNFTCNIGSTIITHNYHRITAIRYKSYDQIKALIYDRFNHIEIKTRTKSTKSSFKCRSRRKDLDLFELHQPVERFQCRPIPCRRIGKEMTVLSLTNGRTTSFYFVQCAMWVKLLLVECLRISIVQIYVTSTG